MVAFTRSQVKCGETPQKKITSERSAYACCGFRMDWCWRTPRGSCAKCGSRSRRLGARVGPGKSIPLTRLATLATLSPRTCEKIGKREDGRIVELSSGVGDRAWPGCLPGLGTTRGEGATPRPWGRADPMGGGVRRGVIYINHGISNIELVLDYES